MISGEKNSNQNDSLKWAHLERYGKHSDNHISKCQIGDEKIGDGLHLTGGGYNPNDQGIPQHRQYADQAIENGQQHDHFDRRLIQ
jgi:hypothetical protein